MSSFNISTDPSWSRAWHKAVPSKVSCLAWRVFQNRVATKDNLFKRGVIDQGSIGCVGECGAEESVTHLFFECPVFAGTWYLISKWLGTFTAYHNEGLVHLDQFEELIGSRRILARSLGVIWFAGIWCIWKARNDKLFKIKEIVLENIIESVKRYSWNRLRFKANRMNYNMDQWFVNPRACLGCVDLQLVVVIAFFGQGARLLSRTI